MFDFVLIVKNTNKVTTNKRNKQPEEVPKGPTKQHQASQQKYKQGKREEVSKRKFIKPQLLRR